MSVNEDALKDNRAIEVSTGKISESSNMESDSSN